MRSIYAYGFENPSDIQKKAIPPIKANRDLIAQAQSGTGKTGAFAIGVLSQINPTLKATQAIVLAPTHELAKQIHSVFCNLSSFIEGISIRIMVGGTMISEEIQEINAN